MSRDLAGKTAGGFKLGDILARGVSSTVYAAEATAGGAQAAVKVLSQDLRDKGAASKLVAEIQRTTAVKHKNLVPVLEVGTVEHKGKRHLYIAMERLHGESLKARLASQPGHALPLHIALQIASDVGGALQAIQRAGGAHRQLTAGAVFLVPPTENERHADPEAEDQVYLLDLGVALVPTESAKDSPKPGKAAKPVDDVRGLALLVRDMLGGLPDTVSTGQNAVLPLRWRNRKIPARVDAVLRQALGDNNDKNGRIESVAKLVAELLGIGDALPTLHAWSEDGRLVMAKPARSWNLAWAAGLALLGGGAVGYWMYAQDPQPTAPQAADLAVVAAPDLAAVSSADLGIGPGSVDAGPTEPRDAGTADLLPHVWPKRTGPKIPPLREAGPAPTSAATPAAPSPASKPTPAGSPAPAATTGTAGTPSGAVKPAPPAATNQQPTGSPGTSPSPAQPDRAQEVK